MKPYELLSYLTYYGFASSNDLAQKLFYSESYSSTEANCWSQKVGQTDRILKDFELLESPAFTVLSAADEFKHPTKRENELWQTDFTYFKIMGWGWYYLCMFLDDVSRYILAWKLTPTMATTEV